MTPDTDRSRQRVVAIVQARTGSVRFPRKVLQEIGGQPALKLLLDRLSHAERLDEVVLAIPLTEDGNALEELAGSLGLRVIHGSEHDVLDRYHYAAVATDADVIVRITGDCPLIDPAVVDIAVSRLLESDVDLVSTDPSCFPDGLDVQVCVLSALERAWRKATETSDREHVLTYLARDPSTRQASVGSPFDMGDVRVTLDEPEDLEVLRAIADQLDVQDPGVSGVAALHELIQREPQILAPNRHLHRNSGATMSTGQKLWSHAKRRIPGGTMLLSKNPDRLLPERWPAYFSRARGCDVWDLDDNRFTDVSFMGVGTNILGYGHPKVDEAVKRTIDHGNLSTLNCPEEVELADLLCELHPWAEMARFTRSGGEACAVAVRIARAASGKDKVAICGYHGWHDWYLAANLGGDGALDGHLLPGLEPLGVPRSLTDTVLPFRYGDLDALTNILATGEVGTIITEVERSTPAPPGYLEEVRRLADEHGAVLIFDECSSGFRRVLGGLHLHHGVAPDLCVLGKTLGNGYAINAVIGRAVAMEAARAAFISSTFWTERIGPTAALAAIRTMKDEDAPRRVHEIGLDVQQRWRQIADAADMQLQIGSAVPAIATFAAPEADTDLLRTFVAQEMLKHSMLATTAFYASIAHTSDVLDRYQDELASVLSNAEQLMRGPGLRSGLKVPAAEARFGRLA